MSSSQRKKCGVLQLGGKKFFIYEGLNLVGRNRDAAAILKDPIASIHHAIITVINECHYVSDVKSTNGTKLDGNKLVPLHTYALEEGSKLEFTPNLSGIYTIIPPNPSQTLLMTQTESQTTQTPDGLFGANTQLEPTALFGNDDEMDQEMSKIVIDTQMMNDSECPNIRNITESKELQREDKEDIHEMETQALVSVPSINDVATQVIEGQTSVLSALTDTQCFTENNDNAVGNSEQEKKCEDVLIHAEDPMMGKISNELSGETSKALNVAEDAPTNDKNESNGDSGSETDVDDEYVAEIANRAKHGSVTTLSTQTVGSETESQAMIKSQGSACSLNLQYSITQPINDADSNSNSSDCFLTGGTNMSLDSALKPVKDFHEELERQKVQEQKVEDTSEAAETREKGRLSQRNAQSEDIISQSEDEAFSFSKGLKPTHNSTLNRRSRFVLSSSEEEDVEEEQKRNPSNQSNPSNDTFAEYEDSFVQRKSVGNATSEFIPATQDLPFQSAESDSFKVVELDVTALKDDVSKQIGVDQSIVQSSSIDEGLESEKSLADDGDVTIHRNFVAPAQPLCVNKSSSHAANPADSINDTQDCDFDAATQQLPQDGVHMEKPDDQDDQDVDFLAPTQDVLRDARAVDEDGFRLPGQPARAFAKSSKGSLANSAGERNDARSDDFDFDAATQRIRPDATDDGRHFGDDDDDLFLAPTQPMVTEKSKEPKRVSFREPGAKMPNVESQLEVMFESQNVSLADADPSRPANPLANMLETCSTQDVVASLTGTGTKRLSSERADNNEAKRAKTTPDVKSTRRSEAPTPTPRVSRSSANKTPKIGVNNNPSVGAGRNKSILDYMQKTSPNGDIFLSSKLSLLKREKCVAKKPEWDSDDDFECLADTVPVDSPKADKSGVNAAATVVSDKARRKILSEEDLAHTPQPVVKLTRISETEVQNGRLSPEEVKEPIEDTKRAKKATKVAKSRRRLRQTDEATKSTHDVDVDLTHKGKSRKTRINMEDAESASKRSKKAVNRSSNSPESNSSAPAESKPRLTRSKRAEEQKSAEAAADPDVEAATTAKRAGRDRKAKALVESPSQPFASDRAKRVTKPKVTFTMLDDPRLKQLIRSLGGSVVEKIETATVLVTTKIQRTLKLLTAIANSTPICSPDWLRACQKANEFVDPWDYLIADGEAEAQWKFQLCASLRCSKEGKIFSGYTFLLLITLSADVIKGAIIANGGKAVLRKPSSGEFTVVATPSQRSKYEAYLKNGTWVISSEAILVSILRQKLDFEEFELK